VTAPRDWPLPLAFAGAEALTPQAAIFVAELVAEVRRLRTDLATAQAALTDHETRISALEP